MACEYVLFYGLLKYMRMIWLFLVHEPIKSFPARRRDVTKACFRPFSIFVGVFVGRHHLLFFVMILVYWCSGMAWIHRICTVSY